MPLTYVSILTTHGQIGYKLYDPNIYGDVMVKNAGERLESIKAAHKSSHGASSVRMEDYLEVIAELVDLKVIRHYIGYIKISGRECSKCKDATPSR